MHKADIVTCRLISRTTFSNIGTSVAEDSGCCIADCLNEKLCLYA